MFECLRVSRRSLCATGSPCSGSSGCCAPASHPPLRHLQPPFQMPANDRVDSDSAARTVSSAPPALHALKDFFVRIGRAISNALMKQIEDVVCAFNVRSTNPEKMALQGEQAKKHKERASFLCASCSFLWFLPVFCSGSALPQRPLWQRPPSSGEPGVSVELPCGGTKSSEKSTGQRSGYSRALRFGKTDQALTEKFVCTDQTNGAHGSGRPGPQIANRQPWLMLHDRHKPASNRPPDNDGFANRIL